MSIENIDQYQGKKIVLVRNEPGKTDAVELEGTATIANEMGILLKPKGKTSLELIDLDQIESVEFVVEKDKPLSRKTLKVVEYGAAKNHLLERHGFTLARVNELSEKDALKLHNSIDHEADDLGHVHGDKNATARAEAVASAENVA